jgi:predicted lipoprotein with Yx(FWY)xxD motif
MRNRWWAASGAAAAVALLAACGSSAGTSGGGGAASSSAPAASSSGGAQSGSTTASTSASGIKTAKTKLGTILVTAQGYTIYLFAIDKPNKSVCFGSCAQFWPPLKGNPTMASGANLPGKFGTIKRAGGGTQATYDGHPLYLFASDKKPGQISGNGVSLDGGVWNALTPSGTKLPKVKAASSTSGGGSTGGYGY